MVSGKALFLGVCLLVFVVVNNAPVKASPQIELMGGYDIIGICITNCAQCKKMYGAFFEGHLCAEACVQFKGKTIPDCEDLSSIAPFLNKMN
ncbi:eclosion hormone [Anopheles gambiae]|uniref:Eclosion hormone n=1 Tax=Anopheles coluzzii TaxID=1518534 RepID=A0A6E8W2K8_ANOCL|nr:eclosion hormone [Anopheles gambiae]XP_040235843.2 eclosion hormone [Anopheles coluzzii]